MYSAYNQIDRDVIWSMLQGIPAYERDIWIKMGMAIKSELGNDGFSLFDDWSNSADNYDPKAVKSVWKSFHGSGVGIGSLVQLAKEYGWQSKNKTIYKAPEIKPAPKQTTSTTKSYALKLWLSSNRDDKYVSAHPYSIKKEIKSAGGAGRGIASGSIIGKNADCIIIPVRNIQTDKVQGVQCINKDDVKQNFGVISGGTLLLGNTLDKSLIWYVTEGWASAYSAVFHIEYGNGVCACSFGKGTQQKVAKLIETAYQPDEIVFLLEDDS